MNPIVRCTFCGNDFEVAKTLVGGYANCPECGKATPVEGLRDPLWRLWQAVVLVVLLLASWVVLTGMGPWPAAGVLVGGIGLTWLVSRGF